MKFKVGDIVKVRKSSVIGCSFADEWEEGGMVGVVCMINKDKDDTSYPYVVFTAQGQGDDHIWVYGKDDLKLIRTKQEVLYSCYGK